MADMNKVFLVGNVVWDPELRQTNSNTTVCGLRVAVNRRHTGRDGKRQDETCFLDVDVFGAQAEPCSKFLSKGSPVLIEGRLRQYGWLGRRQQCLRRQHASADFLPFRRKQTPAHRELSALQPR